MKAGSDFQDQIELLLHVLISKTQEFFIHL
jgi:hypothetical protein